MPRTIDSKYIMASGRNLRRLRQLNGYSQSEIGDIIGVSFQQVQKYERGINCITASKMHTLAELFNVQMDEFFKGME